MQCKSIITIKNIKHKTVRIHAKTNIMKDVFFLDSGTLNGKIKQKSTLIFYQLQ